MAVVVVDQQHDPTTYRSMHSFFQPSPRKFEDRSRHSDNRSICGMDGTQEDEPISPHVNEYLNPDASTPAQIHDQGLTTTMRTSSVSEESASLQADLNHDRRKRRKITPVGSFGVGTGDYITASEAPLGTQPNEQLIDVDHNVASMDGSTDQHMPYGTPPSQKRGTKRTPKKAKDSNKVDGLQNELKQPESGPAASMGSTKVTPGTKMMKLNSNGKLLVTTASNSFPGSPRTRKVRQPVNQPSSTQSHVKMKDGKLVHTLTVVLRYGQDGDSRETTARKIEEILARDPQERPPIAVKGPIITKTTHPFFKGKAMRRVGSSSSLTGSVGTTKAQDSDQEGVAAVVRKPAVPWSDIKFGGAKPVVSKSSCLVDPIWPPTALQHIGRTFQTSSGSDLTHYSPILRKSKDSIIRVDALEDVLLFTEKGLQAQFQNMPGVQIPQKLFISGTNAVDKVDRGIVEVTNNCHAVNKMRERVSTTFSSFDRAEASGPHIWPVQYAPTNSHEVLQASTSVLHDWLESLAVHTVKSGVDKGSKLLPKKLKRGKKLRDEFDDFIADSDDEVQGNGTTIKNAILIVGPNGCGKTASVYAVAKELGFEVFEIHPGMRRSAKDIFDKVGDMTQNHLVQKAEERSRSSSFTPGDTEPVSSQISPFNQPKMAGFLGRKVEKAGAESGSDAKRLPAKKEQKQSLILFEEVDVLFDDDRGFWTGVQNLIRQSRRPVIMTCNDASAVPTSDLDLHTVLTYTAPTNRLATEYLAYLAASEGHLIDRTAISALYASKGNDLRATITELNLWCQLTVGSRQGGIDWMLPCDESSANTDQKGSKLRVFSAGTYRTGLDLLPEILADTEDVLRFQEDSLGIGCEVWEVLGGSCLSSPTSNWPGRSGLDMDQCQILSDAMSCLDIVDNDVSPRLMAAMHRFSHVPHTSATREETISAYINRNAGGSLSRTKFISPLAPIAQEKPVFPPTLGRLAPSLDCPSSTIAVDIAPYVRSIVAFDQRMEAQRYELYGSQGKRTRMTRAARAAVEGGSKAATRCERWFPKNLNFDDVLKTGNGWPQWYATDMESEKFLIADDGLALSQATTEGESEIAMEDVVSA